MDAVDGTALESVSSMRIELPRSVQIGSSASNRPFSASSRRIKDEIRTQEVQTVHGREHELDVSLLSPHEQEYQPERQIQSKTFFLRNAKSMRLFQRSCP